MKVTASLGILRNLIHPEKQQIFISPLIFLLSEAWAWYQDSIVNSFNSVSIRIWKIEFKEVGGSDLIRSVQKSIYSEQSDLSKCINFFMHKCFFSIRLLEKKKYFSPIWSVIHWFTVWVYLRDAGRLVLLQLLLEAGIRTHEGADSFHGGQALLPAVGCDRHQIGHHHGGAARHTS